MSELSRRFEEGGPLSGRGEQVGGNHTNLSEEGPRDLKRRHPSAFLSNLKHNSPSKGGRTVSNLRKLNIHSKTSFKSKNQDSDTESRGGRDWPSTANRKPGSK